MKTRAEATGWKETSLHADVMSFLHRLPGITVGSFGASAEGRDLPLVTLGAATPEEARAKGLPVVMVICGIHAGEVEGKEAIQMLLRDLVAGAHPGLAEPLALVIVPLFNPDGNDRMDPENRRLDLGKLTGQIGPDAVGTRVNAAGINLNRDYLRQASVEMPLLHREVYLRWWPDLTIDCHSTNGSVHRFALTYDTPHTVESGRREPIRFMRDELLPEITRRVRAGSGRETFFYGNFVEDEGGEGGEGEGWMTYTHHPRFGSNYRGLTGRMDLLLETYSYQSFEERTLATYEFLVESLRLVGERSADVRRVNGLSRTPPERIAVRYRLEAEDTPARILTTRKPRTLDGEPIEVTIPHLARFVGAEVVTRPWAYAVPEPIARFLAGHGLAARPATGEARVEITRVAGVEARGSRKILEAEGERLLATETRPAETRPLPAGSWLVETAQQMGAVATYLCEAASDDGLLANGLVGEPAPGSEWPAWRVVEPV